MVNLRERGRFPNPSGPSIAWGGAGRRLSFQEGRLGRLGPQVYPGAGVLAPQRRLLPPQTPHLPCRPPTHPRWKRTGSEKVSAPRGGPSPRSGPITSPLPLAFLPPVQCPRPDVLAPSPPRPCGFFSVRGSRPFPHPTSPSPRGRRRRPRRAGSRGRG